MYISIYVSGAPLEDPEGNEVSGCKLLHQVFPRLRLIWQAQYLGSYQV